MPFASLLPTTRKAAFQSATGYYLAALWPMIVGLARYFGGAFVPVVLWVFAAILLTIPWMMAWTANRSQCIWRAPIAVLASVVPPLGIIGLASPLIAAGYIFPGTRWAGLLAVLLLPGILLSLSVLNFQTRCVALAFVAGFCVGLNIASHIAGRKQPAPPPGWVAVDTYFGDLSRPFQDFKAAQFIQTTAAESPARVLIFPEAVVPTWSAATEAFWDETLGRCRARQQILAFGAGLRANARVHANDATEVTALRRYDFQEAASLLRRMDAATPVGGHRPAGATLPAPSPGDNTLLVVGAESTTYYQRIPVPIGMWRPLDRQSVPLRLRAPSVIVIDHQRVAVLICYEQMLTFPILLSMAQRPTVLPGISNTYWLNGTGVSRYQAGALRGWAKLFRLRLLLAVNS
jgi:hypothetical protein